jgi:hypothetical protein
LRSVAVSFCFASGERLPFVRHQGKIKMNAKYATNREERKWDNAVEMTRVVTMTGEASDPGATGIKEQQNG